MLKLLAALMSRSRRKAVQRMRGTVRVHDERMMKTNALIVAGVHAAAAYACFHASLPNVLALILGHFFVNNIGMVIGLHRYLSHKQFRTSRTVENALALLGTLNLQGGPIRWAATHRAHHRNTDAEGDPHAAHRGFYWSHIGWMLVRSPNGFHFTRSRRYTRELNENPFLLHLEQHYLTINVLAATAFMAASRDLGLFLWAFPLRIVVGWHLTWLINSYSHRSPLLGTATGHVGYRDSAWMSLLLLGEGWHGNHHRHPTSPTTSLHAWQLDPAYWILSFMEKCGLVSLRAHRPSGEPEQ